MHGCGLRGNLSYCVKTGAQTGTGRARGMQWRGVQWRGVREWLPKSAQMLQTFTGKARLRGARF